MASLLLFGPPLLAPVIGRLPESIGGVVGPMGGVGWIVISIPVSIVVFLDWFRTPSPGGRKTLRNIARVPVFLLGVSAAAIGLAVLAWVAHNLWVARQPEFQWSAGANLGLMFAMVGFGVYLIRTSLARPEHLPEEGTVEQAEADGRRGPKGGARS